MSWPSQMTWTDYLIQEAMRPIIVENETSLWHYTDIAAAKGMLETKSYLMTYERHLDDPYEGRGSRPLLNGLIASILGGRHPPRPHNRDRIRALFDRGALVGEALNESELPKRVVFSMCNRSSSERHWVHYGDNGSGVALRLRVRFVPEDSSPESRAKTEARAKDVATTYCTRVHYRKEWTPSAEDARLRKALTDVINSRRSLGTDMQLSKGMYLLLQALAGSYKRQEFEWEDEVRLLAFTQPETQLERLSGSPKERLRLPFDEFFPIEEIVLGPKASEDNLSALEWLVRKHFPGQTIPVTRSALAYR